MAKNQFNIFEDDIKKTMNGLRKQYEKGFSADMDRAAEILQQEYYKVLNEGARNGVTGVMSQARVKIKYKRKYKNIPRIIKVYIPDSSEEDNENYGNIAFHVLNSGRPALGDAHAYGLKAWPMSFPRSRNFGNNPMTNPGSPKINLAYSGEEVAFRRFINNPIKPRNFIKHIYEETKKRLEDEGLDYIDITTTEQD